MPKSPADIQAWLDANSYRLDQPVQFLGTEPNAARRPWDTASVRWCLLASWPYEAAAGNQSIPAVYKALHDHNDTFLCDRFYLPATPADLKLLEKNGLGAFGIESKHPLLDFDIIGSSISYPVLSMSFIKMLTMSGITPRWKDRNANDFPMVMAGGLSYGAPEFLAPIVDCWFLGEAEDEPGNPGIGAVTDRIAALKRMGRWTTDRVGCYADLAREFNFLYFPRFVEVLYDAEDRRHVGVGPHWSKQVTGYVSTLDGMRLPFRKRHVKDLDAIKPLDNPPLLFVDPALGSGDTEVARSCPAWCSFPLAGDEEFITKDGIERIGDVAGKVLEVWTPKGWRYALAEDHGLHIVQKIVFRPADQATRDGSWRAVPRAAARVTITATPCHGWVTVDGEVTHDLQVGMIVSADAVWDHEIDHPAAFVHGFLFGDGTQRHNTTGQRQPIGSGTFNVRLHGKKNRVLHHFEALPTRTGRNGWTYDDDLVVTSISSPDWAKGEPVVHGWASFNVKAWPSLTASPAYLRGFLAGWMAADSTVDKRGKRSAVLDAQYNPKHHGDTTPTQWLQRHAASAGMILVGYSTDEKPTNYGPRSNPLVRHRLADPDNRGWVVELITPVDNPEPVYCLTVPDGHKFTLASGITTGNCAASYRSKPYRQRSVEYITAYAKRLQANMGSTRIAPYSLDLPMYTQRRELIASLLENVSDEVDAASMRVDDFNADHTFILLQVNGGMDSVTLGVEGNSQRLRDLVGKGTSDTDIKEAVTQGIRAGIRKFKLFMISNLPGEDEGDIYRILRLAKDLADIRDSMNQPTVRIQFSWTPLIIDGNTPMQWFAPQPASRILGDVWEEFRDLKIDFKLGSKVEPNKIAFFQLCQRASRDVGEALVDAILAVDQACWGGVPRTFKDTIEASLLAHGFRNGYADCFDERFRRDMFGWEFIDQGVSPELMWRAYVQMREFAEQTDSSTYDLNFDENYHGSEWLMRCDARCYGKSCGVCDYKDLQLRNTYLRATDRDIDLTSLQPVDQHSQAARIRLKIFKRPEMRYVGNDHWRYLLRRAFFRVQDRFSPGWDISVAKRSIRFASDEVKHRDWTYGVDYAEFAFTRPVTDDQITAFLAEAEFQCTGRLTFHGWRRHPVNAVTVRHDVGSMFYDVEIDENIDTATAAIAAFRKADTIPMRLKVEGGYFAPTAETVNAKDYVHDLWLLPHGHQLSLRMLTKGRPNPYNVAAALTGKQSWLPYAKNQSYRLDIFTNIDRAQQDFLRPTCTTCGYGIPINLLDQPYDQYLCPRCMDETGT